MKRRSSKTKAPLAGQLKPFFLVALGWLFIGLSSSRLIESNIPFITLARSFLFFWLLSVLDLFFLAKAVASLLELVSQTHQDGKDYDPAKIFELSLWGVLKFVCLGALILALLKVKSAPTSSLLLGLTTLVLVPLVGGIFWSRRHAWRP